MKIACAALALLLLAPAAFAQNVKITPVGSHPGELCANDPQTDLDAHRGPASARNTELLVATPPGLLGASCAPVAARVPVGALA